MAENSLLKRGLIFYLIAKNNTMKFTLGLLIGASVGAAVVHYLNTYEGKALVNKIKNDADEASENLSGMADQLVSKTNSLLGKTQEQAVDTVERIVLVGSNSW